MYMKLSCIIDFQQAALLVWQC